MNWRHDLDNFLTKHAVKKGSFKVNRYDIKTSRDDMTHMEAVFLPIDRERPALPYDEFIVDGGRHPVGDMENKVGGHFYARYKFPNGTSVSVVCGQLFYSTIDAPYEVRIDGEDEPRGYQTDEELMILLAKAIGDLK